MFSSLIMLIAFDRFGAIFNMLRLLWDDFRIGFDKGPWWQRLFNGYTLTTWLVVLNLGSSGLLVSWLMKYADNIIKVTLMFSAYGNNLSASKCDVFLSRISSIYFLS